MVTPQKIIAKILVFRKYSSIKSFLYFLYYDLTGGNHRRWQSPILRLLLSHGGIHFPPLFKYLGFLGGTISKNIIHFNHQFGSKW